MIHACGPMGKSLTPSELRLPRYRFSIVDISYLNCFHVHCWQYPSLLGKEVLMWAPKKEVSVTSAPRKFIDIDRLFPKWPVIFCLEFYKKVCGHCLKWSSSCSFNFTSNFNWMKQRLARDIFFPLDSMLVEAAILSMSSDFVVLECPIHAEKGEFCTAPFVNKPNALLLSGLHRHVNNI